MTSQSINELRAKARVAVDQLALAEAEKRRLNRRCSRCGIHEDDAPFASLTEARVIVCEGEEGHSDIEQLLCDEHLIDVLDGLRRLGFVNHEHGGTCLLTDLACPGEEDPGACPTPSEYGRYVVHPPRK